MIVLSTPFSSENNERIFLGNTTVVNNISGATTDNTVKKEMLHVSYFYSEFDLYVSLVTYLYFLYTKSVGVYSFQFQSYPADFYRFYLIAKNQPAKQ